MSLCCAIANGAIAPDHFGADGTQISGLAGIEHQRVEFCDLQQLGDDAAHARDVVMQRLPGLSIAKHLDPRAQDRKGRAQLMGRVGRELALHAKTVLEAVERLVDRRDERHDLARNPLDRQANVRAGRADIAGLFRGLPQRRDGAAEDDDVDGEQDQKNGNGDPSDPTEEVGHDVVGNDVAVGQIFPNPDVHGRAADRLRHTRARNRVRPHVAGLAVRGE